MATSPAEATIVQSVKEIIRKYLADPDFGVAQLASMLSLSESHLSRRLQEAGGFSPGKLIRSMRIAHSKSLLRETDLSIKAISIEVGARETAHFTRSFQKEVGMSPSQYRAAERRAPPLPLSTCCSQVPMSKESMSELKQLIQHTDWLRKLLVIIIQHLDQEQFSAADLAQHSQMSHYQLRKLLRARLALSPAQLIRNMRMQFALDLVSDEQRSLSEIAHETGFFDQAHFSRAFKARFRDSPGKYRLKHQTVGHDRGIIQQIWHMIEIDKKT